MNRFIKKSLVAMGILLLPQVQALASSHREAPMISNDPQADNTDLYVFRSPCDSSKVVIIANYIPLENPAGGPNYYNFGTNVRYEIHIKNSTSNPFADDITYRFTFTSTNEDPTTFFNIRLGKQNLKETYTCEKSTNGGVTFTTIMTNGIVPPNNIGPRSITGSPVGLGATDYDALMTNAIMTSTSSAAEKMFCGPIDDPFFVDLGGAFDLGNFRTQGRDAVAKFNCHTIAMEIPISALQVNGQGTASATSILDPNFVIGVWASASRPQITTLSTTPGDSATYSANYVQVSRIGMPLENEVIIPIGMKDQWNASNPYTDDQNYVQYFENPELALYMAEGTVNGTTYYGTAVPGLDSLRIQTNSLGMFDFRNQQPGLFPVKNTSATFGTAFDPINGYSNTLLPDNHSPRAADILPIFLLGIPNAIPYQLATGKTAGNPLSAGKPFINNFLPTNSSNLSPGVADMVRLNMAVPVTPRNDPNFSSLGLVYAAVLGLTNPAYNANANLQFIPNMDGFPNGRRLEDDITTIELQAVSGAVYAAIGLWYDDYTVGGSPLTNDLLRVIGFNAGVTHNDTTFKACFPYVQTPWSGFTGPSYQGPAPLAITQLPLNTPTVVMNAYPNPFSDQVTFTYKTATDATIQIMIVDVNGRLVKTINEGHKATGEYNTVWSGNSLPAGNYFANLMVGNTKVQSVKLVKVK